MLKNNRLMELDTTDNFSAIVYNCENFLWLPVCLLSCTPDPFSKGDHYLRKEFAALRVDVFQMGGKTVLNDVYCLNIDVCVRVHCGLTAGFCCTLVEDCHC